MKLRFRDWPFRWKLLALGAAASAVPLVVTTVVAFRTGSTLMRQSALELLAARADHLAGDLDSFHLGFRRAKRSPASVARTSTIPLMETVSRTSRWTGASTVCSGAK